MCSTGNNPTTKLSPEEALIRAGVRRRANMAQERGKIEKRPCEKCGAPDAQKHHPDYGKPLEVIWLCKPCHKDWHKQNEAVRSTDPRERQSKLDQSVCSTCKSSPPRKNQRTCKGCHADLMAIYRLQRKLYMKQLEQKIQEMSQ
jgi:hypothetical protein